MKKMVLGLAATAVMAVAAPAGAQTRTAHMPTPRPILHLPITLHTAAHGHALPRPIFTLPKL